MGAVSPSSSSSSASLYAAAAAAVAAVQRGHVASLAVVDAPLLAAAHLADGRREHHLDPLHAAAASPGLSVSWQRRYEAERDERQKAAESRPRHFFTLCCGQEFVSASRIVQNSAEPRPLSDSYLTRVPLPPPPPPPSPFPPPSRSLSALEFKTSVAGEKGRKEEEK